MNILEAIKNKIPICTRHGYPVEIISVDDKTYNSFVCKRPIKYKVLYDDDMFTIHYCDVDGKCNSNKYIITDCTHDLILATNKN